MIKRCVGCGSVLQNTDLDKVGYVNDISHDYCMRCFRVINYNEDNDKTLDYSNGDIVDIINQNADLCLFLADLITLNKEVINIFKSITAKKVLVINKTDLLPHSISDNKIISFLEDRYQIIDKVVMISSLKKNNLAVIKNIIDTNHDVYFAGFTNAGKSSLINSLMEKYHGEKAKNTISLIPNTTIDFIKLSFLNSKIIDCPGFNYENKLINSDMNIIKKVNSKKQIRPVTLQIKDNDIICIDDRWLISVSNRNSITFYFSNNFSIKKVYDKEFSGELLNVKSDSDLIIKGVGFINFKKSCTIKVNFSLDLLEKRDSIFM